MKGTLEKTLYQWDTGQYLTLDEECTWADYSIAGLPGCVRVPVETGGTEEEPTYQARIPNLVLTYSGQLTILLVEEDDDGHRTEARQDEFITRRAKPADYVYTDDEYISLSKIMDELRERLSEIKALIAGGATTEASNKLDELIIGAGKLG